MSVLEKRSGNTANANSGYSGLLTDGSEFNEKAREWPDDKYLDIYTSTSTATACNGKPCKGHALSEVVEWYGDSAVMVEMIKPWMIRGGSHASSPSSAAGVFYYVNNYGNAGGTFRIVLTPQ